MHKLLARQLKRYVGSLDNIPEEWQQFIASVNAAYEQADIDRTLLEHSLELTSQELIARNQELQQDILARQNVEEALRASEASYRRLVELTPDGIAIIRNGIIVFINPAGVALLGATDAAQIIGKRALDFVHPAYREAVLARAQAMLAEGLSTPLIEEQFVRLDGSVFDAESLAIPFTLDNQPALQVIFRDITARKRAEEQRLVMERKLQETQRLESLGVLAGGIAHDFNNLLAAILGNAELALLDLTPDAPAWANVAQIQVASRRAADLTQQMLAYSGKGRFLIQPLDLSVVVAEMATLLRAAIPKHLTIRQRHTPNLPLIEADATQVRQVILNLLLNAAEAISGQEGVISVTTSVRAVDQAYLSRCYLAPDRPANQYVVLEVADTGSGIEAMTLPKIFEPFFTTKFTGRGLGLAAVLGIVRGHHGGINIASTVGRGTTFSVLFPPATAAVAPPENTSPAATQWRGKGTVLVVDDEDHVRAVATRMLERDGFTVLSASDGVAGVELFQTHAQSICCVLLDLTMPRLSGEETVHALRGIRAEVPIVLMSGYSGDEITARFPDQGSLSFVAKPFTPSALRAGLHKVLEQHGGVPVG